MKPKDPAKVSAENTLRMETIRQQVIRILQDGFFDVRQLSQELGIMEKEVYNHLEHIQLTLKSLNKKLVIKQASCLSCNYVFKDRKKQPLPAIVQNVKKLTSNVLCIQLNSKWALGFSAR